MTDLWRAEGWLVPQGNILTPATWQALLGGAFLLTFLIWAWFAFIRPPTYSRYNAKRFARTLYRFVLKGNSAELAVIADELTNSARALVRHAPDHVEPAQNELPMVEGYANDILLLIADKRLCQAIVNSSPGTALAIFDEMSTAQKYGIQIKIFARNIVNEAIANRDSFLYHEADGYESGLLGYHKPLSQAMFSNYRLVDTVEILLDVDVLGQSKWDAAQWESYCRAVLIALQGYVDQQFWNHSAVLYRAKGYIERATSDIYTLNGTSNIESNNDSLARLHVVVQFIEDAVDILNKKGVPDRLQRRIREQHSLRHKTFYDHLAGMIYKVVWSASAVTTPRQECWWIQQTSVWHTLSHSDKLSNPAGKIVKFKVRRLLYDQIVYMTNYPNFEGARILGFCLNVMGLSIGDRNNLNRDNRALHKAILAWTQKNFAWLHSYNSEVAEVCLVDGMSYEAKKLRLVMTYPANGLRREPHHVYLEVDPPPAGTMPASASPHVARRQVKKPGRASRPGF